MHCDQWRLHRVSATIAGLNSADSPEAARYLSKSRKFPIPLVPRFGSRARLRPHPLLRAGHDRQRRKVLVDSIDNLLVHGQVHLLGFPSLHDVNRRRNGTPYRLPKGTPASGCIGSARVGPELSI